MTNHSDMSENKENEKSSTDQELLIETFKHCQRIFRQIKKMPRDQLLEKLEYYGLSTKGSINVLKRRLRESYRRFKFSELDVDIKSPTYPYYVVIDFEATCSRKNQGDYPHEIIEFPAVLINSKTLEVEDTFQMYCKPVINPKLSDFCMELTGITQDQVDSAESFTAVLKHFENWLMNHQLLGKKIRFSTVADTPYDMSRFLYQQCVYSGISFPKWGKKWVNIKPVFGKFYKVKNRTLLKMLDFFNMEFEGRLHCGLDDAKNIARVAIRMIRDGCIMEPNESIILDQKAAKKYQMKIIDGGDENDKYKKLERSIRGRYKKLDNFGQKNTYYRSMLEREKILLEMEKELMENSDADDSKEGSVEWLPRELLNEYRKSTVVWWD